MGELVISNEAYLSCLKRYVITEYGASLDLSLCPPLRIVEAGGLPKDVLTRIEEESILVSMEQILRCKGKVPNIEEFLQGSELDRQDSDLQLLMQNLLHEFCHVDAKKKMSNLHGYMMDERTSVIDSLIAHYWIEFCVETESLKRFYKEDKFSQSFVDYKWEIQYFKSNRNDRHDMFWLIYTSSYFIANNFVNGTIQEYLSKICDDSLKEYCLELYNKSTEIYVEKMPFDNFEQIKALYDRFDGYWKRRKRRA